MASTMTSICGLGASVNAVLPSVETFLVRVKYLVDLPPSPPLLLALLQF